MNPSKSAPILALALLAIALPGFTDPELKQAVELPIARTEHIDRIQVLRMRGGRVSWSKRRNLIAFDMQGSDGFYDLYVMKPDGSGETCLTCGKVGRVPQKHNGQPEWHPSGDYILFQSEKESHPGNSNQATPGFGRHSDLWLMSTDGEKFFQLTNGPASLDHGVLHPHFSADGRRVSWGEMYNKPRLASGTGAAGYWKLKVADFKIDPKGPLLTNTREYEPGGPAFYENHGLSPNGDRILFSSNFEARHSLQLKAHNIYVMDLPSGRPVRLAQDGFNEHAQWSPNHRKILWMSSAGNRNRGTDYWLMNADGSNKIRLTNFNDPNNPKSRGRLLVCADSAWSPDGQRIAAYVFTNLRRQQGMLIMLDLNKELGRSTR